MAMNRAYWLDMAERVGATAGEAGLGVAITEFSSLPMWCAVLLVGKGLLHVGGTPARQAIRHELPGVVEALN